MKFLIPMVIALLGLGAGVGAGLALKPAPEEHGETAAADCDPHDAHGCEEMAADPFKAKAERKHAKEDLVYVPLQKPFIVPVFREEKVTAMVVLSLSMEAVAGHEIEKKIEGVEPRLRDVLLNVMFRHANSDGFAGSFTTGRKMEDLKAAMLVAVEDVMGPDKVVGVLVTEIARQDV